MFNFLKKLRGPSKATAGGIDMDEGIRLVALRDSTLIFESQSVFPLNQPLDLTATIPLPDGTSRRRRAEVVLRDARLQQGDMREYTGDLEDASPELRDFMKKVIAHQEEERRRMLQARGEQRTRGRAQLSFQVMSRDIRNFKAISGDISNTGIKIFVDEELPVGKNIDLRMNFDDDNFPHISCRADVMWCRPTDRSYAVGLRFSDLTPEQQETVEAYIDYVERFRERMT